MKLRNSIWPFSVNTITYKIPIIFLILPVTVRAAIFRGSTGLGLRSRGFLFSSSHFPSSQITFVNTKLYSKMPPNSSSDSTSKPPLPETITSSKLNPFDDFKCDIKPIVPKSSSNFPKQQPTLEQENSSSITSSLLYSWATHDDDSFHDFTPSEALAIRKALVKWYRSNRRKLPWRGDLPPYDGSTAGYTTGNNNGSNSAKFSKAKRSQTESKNTKSAITNYFAVKKTPPTKVHEQKKDKEVTPSIDSDLKQEVDLITETISDSPSSNNTDSKMNLNKKFNCAYGVWVSEIMLQQTRVEAVIPYYLKWMKSFPTVEALANATEEEVNSHWAGLGFYRRARLLHSGSKQVIEQYNGILPSTVKELLTINGIGPYTASAIASIAYNVSVPVVDGNVCRVLARLKGIANHIKSPVLKDDLGWKLAGQIVNAGKLPSRDNNNDDADKYINDDDDYGSPSEVNQALMELGATYCAPSGSGMDDLDPLKEFYMSTKISKEIAKHMKIGENNFALNKNKSNNDDKNKNETPSITMYDILEQTEVIRQKNESKGKKCKLCDPDGIPTVLTQITNDFNDSMHSSSSSGGNNDLLDAYKIGSIGHDAFPTAPPKKAKREEVMAVAALCDMSQSNERWLMIQRPRKGLLAGQWEFPAVCVWSSADDKTSNTSNSNKKSPPTKLKKKETGKGKVGGKDKMDLVPFIEPKVRNQSLSEFLEQHVFSSTSNDEENRVMLQSFSTLPRKAIGEDALEHIFSHIRHTMWVEYASLSFPSEFTSSWVVGSASNFNGNNGNHEDENEKRDVRWMSEADMKTVGVTSGVKKILTAVKKHRDIVTLKKKRKR